MLKFGYYFLGRLRIWHAVFIHKDIIEKKNHDITSAINYAGRIQQAILPENFEIENSLRHYFIFFRPRDIVTGDFYWFGKISAEKYVLAAVDCTGHGVPGAFMSLIGNDLLNDIITVRHTFSPELILEELHSGVKKALRQEDGENRDGMDLALCVLNPVRETVEFAGAMNPLVYISENKITTLRGDRMPIGGELQGRKLRKYTKHTIRLEQAGRFYLFSDGYQDQFGGPKGGKYLRARFREFITGISHLPMSRQHDLISEEFEDWKKSSRRGQTDDVLVAGFRLL